MKACGVMDAVGDPAVGPKFTLPPPPRLPLADPAAPGEGGGGFIVEDTPADKGVDAAGGIAAGDIIVDRLDWIGGVAGVPVETDMDTNPP